MSLNYSPQVMSPFSISDDKPIDSGLHSSGYSSCSSSSSKYTMSYTSNNNEVTAQANIIPIPVKEKKIYPCNLCSKFFNRPSALETHNYTHTLEKPFQCLSANCGRRFSVVSNLRRHFKVHQKGLNTVNKISPQERLHCVRKLIKKNSRNPNAPSNFYDKLVNTTLGYKAIDSQLLTSTTIHHQNDTMLSPIMVEDDITQYIYDCQMVTEQEANLVIQKPCVCRAISYNVNQTQNDDQLIGDRSENVAYQQSDTNISFSRFDHFDF